MSSHPTSKARRRRQKLKRKYAGFREDAQLLGIIPTVPKGAVKDECVAASAQSEQPFPELIAQAIRKGWAVEEEKKPGLVDELVRIVLDPNMPAKAKITAFNALRMADKDQWERDNPDKAGQAAPTVLNINVVESNPPGAKHTPLPLPSTVESGYDGNVLYGR